MLSPEIFSAFTKHAGVLRTGANLASTAGKGLWHGAKAVGGGTPGGGAAVLALGAGGTALGVPAVATHVADSARKTRQPFSSRGL